MGQGAETAKGAAGGAASGAAMGAAFGPWGAAIGGVAGGLYGGYKGYKSSATSGHEDQNRQMLNDYYARVMGRGGQGMQMGPAAQGQMSGFRQNQSDLISRLEAQSKGQGPSLANEQFRANADRLGAQQSSIANSGRGGPLAAQAAANNTALIGAQASQGAVQGRLQEQQNATNQLGLTLHGARGYDEDMSRFNAGQQNEVAAQNLGARLKAMGLDDDTILRIMQQQGNAAQNQYGRPTEGDALLAGGINAFSTYATQSAQQKANQPKSAPTGTDPLNTAWRQQLNS